MSTPTSLDLPPATRRGAVETVRGTFAVLEALPEAGAADAAGLGTALLVPGVWYWPRMSTASTRRPAAESRPSTGMKSSLLTV